MVQNLLRIADNGSADPLAPPQSVPGLSSADTRDRCVHELFEKQAERSPEVIAVVSNDRQLTYAELNARANQLARFLKRFGVGSDSRVGLCIDQSPEMVVGILGILKAGAGYVSLDPTYSQARLSLMMRDANIFVLLTQAHLLDFLPRHNGPRLCLDSDWDIIAKERPDNSTGFPSRDDWTPHWKNAALRARR